jgi:hypothetical protein
MLDWSLTSIGPVLTGNRITVVCFIIPVMLPGFRKTITPFLLCSTTVLTVISAFSVVFTMPRYPPSL